MIGMMGVCFSGPFRNRNEPYQSVEWACGVAGPFCGAMLPRLAQKAQLDYRLGVEVHGSTENGPDARNHRSRKELDAGLIICPSVEDTASFTAHYTCSGEEWADHEV